MVYVVTKHGCVSVFDLQFGDQIFPLIFASRTTLSGFNALTKKLKVSIFKLFVIIEQYLH
jgi:hypothetical protein